MTASIQFKCTLRKPMNVQKNTKKHKRRSVYMTYVQ